MCRARVRSAPRPSSCRRMEQVQLGPRRRLLPEAIEEAHDSGSSESLFEISPERVGALQADREPEQARGDAISLPA